MSSSGSSQGERRDRSPSHRPSPRTRLSSFDDAVRDDVRKSKEVPQRVYHELDSTRCAPRFDWLLSRSDLSNGDQAQIDGVTRGPATSPTCTMGNVEYSGTAKNASHLRDAKIQFLSSGV